MTYKEKIVKEAAAEFMEMLSGDVLGPEEWERKMKKIFRKVYDGGYAKCLREWCKWWERNQTSFTKKWFC